MSTVVTTIQEVLATSHESLNATPRRRETTLLSAQTLEPDHEAGKHTQQSIRNAIHDPLGNAFKVPEFTIKDIRAAIPSHCYERSALTASGYVLRDVAMLILVFCVFNKLTDPSVIPSASARIALWILYGFIQGLFGTGLWVIGHECGHGSFSANRIINDTAGCIIHSALLVPYWSWKISHSQHHKHAGHTEKDMVWVPRKRDSYAASFGKLAHEVSEMAEEAPFITVLRILALHIFGFPLYLITNLTGNTNHDKLPDGRGVGRQNGFFGGVTHFDPTSPLFEPKHRTKVLMSDVSFAMACAVLGYIGYAHGMLNLTKWYLIPYTWVNSWVVIITFLQHTDPTLPHYGPEMWTFTRGAAATMDRDLGFLGREIFHHITDTHILHHLVHAIPFYHASEATEAIKPVMGEFYKSDAPKDIVTYIRKLWSVMRHCQWVEPHADVFNGPEREVYFYKNRNGLGSPPMKLQPEPDAPALKPTSILTKLRRLDFAI